MLVKDFNRYSEYVYRVEKNQVEKQEGDSYYINMKLDTFPLPGRRLIVKYDVDDAAKSLDFSMMEVLEGDANDFHGYMRLDDTLGGGFTKITFSSFVDFDLYWFMVPGANIFTEMMLEKWIEAIRERVKEPIFLEYVRSVELEKNEREAEREKLRDKKLKNLDINM